MNVPQKPLKFFSEVLGIRPSRQFWEQVRLTMFGAPDVPKSKAGLSSLKLLNPRIGVPLWRGKYFIDRQIIITNLFNHTQTDITKGWSVKRTQTRDFRGKNLTYDSHNGTDWAVPVGSKVLSAAAGVVAFVGSEFNRGGLKIYIDHGQGLMTSYAHLARSVVKAGDNICAGTHIAWSGYSGIDACLSFPFGIPHVHMNVWFNGCSADPFPHGEVPSLWKNEQPGFVDPDDEYRPSVYDPQKIKEGIAACVNASVKNKLSEIEDIDMRARHLLIQQNYYPTRFREHICPYAEQFTRKPRLRIPFCETEFEGFLFRDTLN